MLDEKELAELRATYPPLNDKDFLRMAATLYSYFNAQIEHGFTGEEAMAMSMEWYRLALVKHYAPRTAQALVRRREASDDITARLKGTAKAELNRRP